MKKVVLYICEYCHKEYENNEECARCEIEHKIPIRIASAEYEPDGSGGRYPKKIRIKMSDGNAITYKR